MTDISGTLLAMDTTSTITIVKGDIPVAKNAGVAGRSPMDTAIKIIADQLQPGESALVEPWGELRRDSRSMTVRRAVKRTGVPLSVHHRGQDVWVKRL